MLSVTQKAGLVLTFAFWLLPAHAEIYKWTDENGRVHFTDEPPANKGEKVDVQIAPPPASPDVGERRRLQLLEFAKARDEQEAAMADLTDPADENTRAAALHNTDVCRAARIRYYVVTQEMPVYWTEGGAVRPHMRSDTYQGEREFIDDAEREVLLFQAYYQIEASCPNGEIDEEDGSAYEAWLRSERCLASKHALEFETQARMRNTEQRIRNLKASVRENCD